MTDIAKSSDPAVREMLKALGMPERCVRVEIVFEGSGPVRMNLEKVLDCGEIEVVKAWLADKSATDPV